MEIRRLGDVLKKDGPVTLIKSVLNHRHRLWHLAQRQAQHLVQLQAPRLRQHRCLRLLLLVDRLRQLRMMHNWLQQRSDSDEAVNKMCVDFDYNKHKDNVENHDKPPGYV